MPKLLIYKQGTEELLHQVKSYRDCYKFQLNYLRQNGIDTYVKRPIKKKSEMQKLDDKCAKLWREIIFCDADYKCEKCKNSSKQLHPHHIITRANKVLRWDLENGICLCATHHTLSSSFSAHQTPAGFKVWLERHKGIGFYENLEYRGNTEKKKKLEVTLQYLENEAKKRGLE